MAMHPMREGGGGGGGIAAPRFDLLDAMRGEHASLLSSAPTGEIDAALRDRVFDFLRRGAATGAILDDPADRRLAQGLLDYWKATLYTQRRDDTSKTTLELPKSLLVPFREDTAKEWAAAGDKALHALTTDAEREAVRRVLMRLVRLESNGRDFAPVTVPRATLEAAGDAEAINRAIAALVEPGILRVEHGATSAEDQISIRYESLVRTWEQLREWLRQRLQFRDAAEFWHRTGRKREAVVTGDLLAEALRYRDLGPLEQDFADASRDEAARLANIAEETRQREQLLTRQAADAQLREAESQAKEVQAQLRESESARLRERLRRRAAWVVVGLCGALLVAVAMSADQGWKAVNEEKARTKAEQARADDAEKVQKALDDKVKAYQDKEKAEAAAKVAKDEATIAQTRVTKLSGDLEVSNKRATDAAHTSFLISQSPPKPIGWKLWRAGETLRVRFADGDRNLRDEVLKTAAQWSAAAKNGIRFKESEDPDSEIRISLKPGGGNSSFIGTDALSVPVGQCTMYLDLSTVCPERPFATTILRNFGFALGLVSETSNPSCAIEWDEEKVYARFGTPPYSWDRERIRALLLRRYSATEMPWYRPFDVNSVMAISVPAALMIPTAEQRPFDIPVNTELSASDKRFIAALYPVGKPPVKLMILPQMVIQQGACKTFRAFDRYEFTLRERTRVTFEVEIGPNVGITLYRLVERGRPVEMQTLNTPTQKHHKFTMTLDAGTYQGEFYGRIPSQGVTEPFGAAWLDGGMPGGWNGKYELRVQSEK